MERIERLERANKRWQVVCLCAVVALIGALSFTAYAFTQREQEKGGQPPQPAPEFPMETAKPLPVTYTNFVRVSVTPEELILDLALNTQVTPDAKQPIQVTNRVVMNFFTVKRLSLALQQVLQQHEAVYGPIELDFQKRAVRGGKGP